MHSKNEALINRLIEKTDAGELNWETTSRSMQFTLSMASNQLIIERISAPSGIRYKFAILNEDGSEIDSLTKSTSAADHDLSLLRNLYELARRNANHIDTTIDNLLNELN